MSRANRLKDIDRFALYELVKEAMADGSAATMTAAEFMKLAECSIGCKVSIGNIEGILRAKDTCVSDVFKVANNGNNSPFTKLRALELRIASIEERIAGL